MEKKKLKSDVVFTFISLLSLLYIRYYEITLYYKPINKFLDIIYENVAIPSFYFFITAYIGIVVINLFKINISKILSKMLKWAVGLALILYTILVFIKTIGIITTPFISFVSIYSILFSILGCLFALAIHKNYNEESRNL